MKVGYARVSTDDQDLTIQLNALTQAGCDKIFSEKISGKDNQRPQLEAMMQILREDDTVVVYKIDRLGRSTMGLIFLVEELNKIGAHLRSLDSSDNIDTTTPMGMAMLQIVSVFAELERKTIKARMKAGRELAKAQGKHLGRPFGSKGKKAQHKVERIKLFLKAGKTAAWIKKELKVSPTTILQVKKEYMQVNWAD